MIIIEQDDASITVPVAELPDGLEGLRRHNLLTYKSKHEALDAWALDELVGHYVNYRKLTAVATAAATGSADGDGAERQASRLLPTDEFRLYAVATRAPWGLCGKVACRPTAMAGVLDLRWGLHDVRLIVLDDIAKHPRNAPWELFSADLGRIRHGAEHYRPHRPGAETLLYELYLRYKLEDPTMPYTFEDFLRESREHMLSDPTGDLRRALLERMSLEDRLHGLPPEQRQALLERMSPEERLRGLPPEELLGGLSAEERRRLKALLRDADD